MISDLNQHRRDFWRFFAEHLPNLHGRMVRGNEHSRWLFVGHRPLVIAHYIANRGVGMFLRGPAREPVHETRNYLVPHRSFLAERLDKPDIKLGSMFLLPHSLRIDMTDRAAWNSAVLWFAQNSPAYERIFTDLQASPEPWPDEFPPPDFWKDERRDREPE